MSEQEWLEWEPQYLSAHAAVNDSSELLAQAAAKVCVVHGLKLAWA